MRHQFLQLLILGFVLWGAFFTVQGDLGGCLHGEVRGTIPSEVCQEIMNAVMGLSMCASNTQCFTRAGKGWQKRRKWQWICLTKLPLGLHKASAVLWNHCVCIRNDLTTIFFTLPSSKLDIVVKIRVDKSLHMHTQWFCKVKHLFSLSPCLDFFKQLKTELRFFWFCYFLALSF